MFTGSIGADQIGQSVAADLQEHGIGVLPSVSVIVPFRGSDTKPLSVCLEALQRQDYPADKIEILVINNNDADDDLGLTASSIRVVWQKPRGSYAARNAGLAIATGDILAFTDGDCEPRPDWLRNGVAALVADPELGFAAGHIAFTFRRRPNLIELYDSVMHFRQEEYVSCAGFGATANLFTRASVMATVGSFNELFLSGGDREWGERVTLRGYRSIFLANAIVDHPARATFAEIFEKARRFVGQELTYATRAGRTWPEAILRQELRSIRRGIRLTLELIPRWGIVRTIGAAGVTALVAAVRLTEWLRLLSIGRIGFFRARPIAQP